MRAATDTSEPASLFHSHVVEEDGVYLANIEKNLQMLAEDKIIFFMTPSKDITMQ